MADININKTKNSALEGLEDSLVQFDTNYTQTVWADGQQPAINATNLSKIEGGIGSVNTYLNNGNRTNIEALTTTISALKLEEEHRIDNDDAIIQALLTEESRAETSEAAIQSEIGGINDAPENQVEIGGDKVSTVYGQLNSLRADYQNLIGESTDAADEKVYIKVLNKVNEDWEFDTVECSTVHSRITDTIETFNGEIGSINTSIGGVQDTSDKPTVHGRIKKLEEFVGESDDESNDTVNRGGKDVPTVNARVRKVEEHVGKASDASTASTVHGRIKKVEDFIGEYNDPANKKVDRNGSSVPTVNARIQSAENRITNTENHIGKSTDDATQGTVHGRIQKAEDSITSQYTTLTKEYKSYTDGEIDTLHNTVKTCTIEELNTATNSKINDHESRITDHEDRINDIETSANYSSVKALEERVDNLTLYDMNDTTDSFIVILDGGELS
jgi:hypothetical protein